MKTAISIPDPLFESAERLAARLGRSRRELYQHAIREFVRKHRNSMGRERLDRVYGADDDRGGLDPALELMQLDSVDREEW